MLEPLVINNKSAAPIQITADQLILESVSRMKDRPRLPENVYKNQQELEDARFKRRQDWENKVRRNLCPNDQFVRYARWEEDIGQLDKARSVFERGLEFSRFRDPMVWNCYIDMELRNKAIMHARNILERAVTILPREDKFWLRYCLLEEDLRNIEGTREIFQRWISWEPPVHAFLAFAEFEMRNKDVSRARSVFERLLIVHPQTESYIRYADFEIKQNQTNRARMVYERALEALGPSDDLLIVFAHLEEQDGEIERARVLLSSTTDTTARLEFEKRHGKEGQIDALLNETRKRQLRETIAKDPQDFDSWYELCDLVSCTETEDKVTECYSDALAVMPEKKDEKRDMSKYVLLGLSWAMYEETVKHDVHKAREIYTKLLSCINHKKYTFSRLWIMYAYFEIRQRNIDLARKIFGTSIGKCPRSAVFDAYIDMEILLGEEDRARILFDRFIDLIPDEIRAWVRYAQFESQRGNIESARSIFEKALECEAIDNLELLWSVYIDFESKVGTPEAVEALYRRALETVMSVSLWKGRILFVAEVLGDEVAARNLFEELESKFIGQRDEIRMIREFRVDFEKSFGSAESIEEAESKLGKFDESLGRYVFPEEMEDSISRLIEVADQWEKLEI